eukprot:1159747-Pelagomonas_calceolata.AAC.6
MMGMVDFKNKHNKGQVWQYRPVNPLWLTPMFPNNMKCVSACLQVSREQWHYSLILLQREMFFFKGIRLGKEKKRKEEDDVGHKGDANEK